MRARPRLGTYLVLWVVSLLSVPVLLPPAREPTYGPPPLAAGYNWIYGEATSYQAPSSGSGSTLFAVEQPSIPQGGGNALENWSFLPAEKPFPHWPFVSWQLSYSDGSWSALTFRCPDGTVEHANLTHPIPGGLTFPLGGSGEQSGRSPATLKGDCVGGPTGAVQAAGGYQRWHPPQGAASCVLYVCNDYRVYSMWDELTVWGNSSSAPSDEWTLQGVYDPIFSGYQALSVSPGPGPAGTYANGSQNLSAQGPGGVGTFPSPDPVWGYFQSAGLLLTIPALALAGEAIAFRRSDRRAERETEERVLAALDEKEAEGVPRSEVYDGSLDESASRPPG